MPTIHNAQAGAADSRLRQGFNLFVMPALRRGTTYGLMGLAILLLDIFTSRYLQFPILFVIPVALSAWFCRARFAYWIAVLLPLAGWGLPRFWNRRPRLCMPW